MRIRTMLLVALVPCLAAQAATPVLNTLYKFTGPVGAYPEAPLAFGANGVLYGTTTQGGAAQGGTVFQLAPPTTGKTWTATRIYSFPAQKGVLENPTGLIYSSTGSLFGATMNGGTAGKGSVFQLTKSGSAWTATTLHSFAGGANDGASPAGGLISDFNGALYGVTTSGGPSNAGTVFMLTPPAVAGGAWTESVLYSFGQTGDGTAPAGNLVFDAKGSLYGVTTVGGSSGKGTVYQITPPNTSGSPWTETILYNFTGASDGSTPQGGLILGKRGVLYGVTEFGGNASPGMGTVFSLTPPGKTGGPWIETVLYSFQGGNDGANPVAGLAGNTAGDLFGTTSAGGIDALGTVFKLTVPAQGSSTWTESVLYQFQFSDGSLPVAGLVIDSGGNLYGTTENGGTLEKGTVFKLRP